MDRITSSTAATAPPIRIGSGMPLLYDYAAAAAHSGTAWLRGEPEAEKYFNSTCGDRMSGVFFVVFKNGIRKRDARASL